MRKRLPTQEELDIWNEVTRTIRAVPRRRLTEDIESPQPHSFPHPAATVPQPLPDLRIGQKIPAKKSVTTNLMPSLSDHLAKAPLQMDAKTHSRMQRGRLDPEARIDLHGMTVAEAHGELIYFLLNARAAGHRLVLVITGKGRPSQDHGPIPSRMGVIRHQLPHWLRLPPLNGLVQQLSESHARHGGAGAFYLYLRKAGR